MRFLATVFLFALLAIVAIFCFQNREVVRVAFLNWAVELPIWLLAVLIYLLGMLSGGALLTLLRRSLRYATENRPQTPAI